METAKRINQEAGVDEVDFTKSMKLHEISIKEVADDAFKAGMMKVVKLLLSKGCWGYWDSKERLIVCKQDKAQEFCIKSADLRQFLKDNGLDKE